MGLSLALRFFSLLYRSGINGIEDQIWLNFFNIIILSSKFIGGYFVIFYTKDFSKYFEFQLFVTCIEVYLLKARLKKQIPIKIFPLFSFYFDKVIESKKIKSGKSEFLKGLLLIETGYKLSGCKFIQKSIKLNYPDAIKYGPNLCN